MTTDARRNCADCGASGAPLCDSCATRRRRDARAGGALTAIPAAAAVAVGLHRDRPLDGVLVAVLVVALAVTIVEFGRLVLKRRLTWTGGALLSLFLLGLAAGGWHLVARNIVRSAFPVIGVGLFLWLTVSRLALGDSWGKLLRLTFVATAAGAVWMGLLAGAVALVGSLLVSSNR